MLDSVLASRFARLTLDHLGRPWPYKPDHILTGPADVRAPAEVHPIFHGSFDWHSCVHGWWQVLRLARRFPGIAEAPAIRARADAMLVPHKVAGELAYIARPTSRSFSRPYGWAWLLALHREADAHDAGWGDALAPLAATLARMLGDYLTRMTYPIRVGTHFNSSFAMIHAHRWGEAFDPALAALIAARAAAWFGDDRGCQAWEPGGDEFLSPALTEALLMQRVLPARVFADWFAAFLPSVPATLATPAHVSDRRDGKIAHLDGLNLSRAWCWRALGRADLADTHIAASLPHIADDYMGTHWLATFALLAIDGD